MGNVTASLGLSRSAQAHASARCARGRPARAHSHLATRGKHPQNAAASPPRIAIVASASADWSNKSHAGREIRLALELVGRGDDPAETGVLAARIEQRIATLAPQQAGYRVVVTQFLRSRVERRARSMRAVLLEYRFMLIETE